MNRSFATILATAAGLALALQAAPASAGKNDQSNDATEKCYGIADSGKNDCATEAHGCAGQSTQANDPNSFVLVPAGECTKLGGKPG